MNYNLENLRKELEAYKKYTLELITALEEEKIDSLSDILDNREKIIKNMDKLEYSKEEFSSIATELQIITLQEKLKNLINNKRLDVKDKINNILNNKTANKSYKRTSAVDSIYFNKKI